MAFWTKVEPQSGTVMERAPRRRFDRVLIASVGSLGDVHPFLAIGAALVTRGYAVTMATNAAYEPLVRQAGLDFHCLWSRDEMEHLFQNPDLWHRTKGPALAWHHMAVPTMRRCYRFIERAAAREQCLVLASWSAFGARLANERLGVSLCTAYQAPTTLDACDTTGVRVSPRALRDLNAMFTPELNRLRQELGMKPVADICDRWMHSPQMGITLFPRWFGEPQVWWPRQVMSGGFAFFDGDAISAEPPRLTEFLHAGPRPLVFCALSEMREAGDFFELSVQATRALGYRAILLTRYPAQLPVQLSPDIVHVEYAQFSKLLPRAAALVHFGGIGTCAQAMRAGVPQLIVPCAHDQYDNAARISSLRVGIQLRQEEYMSAPPIATLERLVRDEQLRAGCAVIARRFDGVDAVDGVCRAIEQFPLTMEC